MKYFSSLLFCIITLVSCGQNKVIKSKEEKVLVKIINPEGKRLETRFNPPEGYVREKYDENSFEYYLRNLPLKPDGSKVHYYDGKVMTSDYVYVAVVDMEIGKTDLEQCADAVIRMRAEYLFKQKQYDNIHFNLTNGFRADYSKWAEGYRIKVNGNKTTWVKIANKDDSYKSFRQYLDIVFTYAGTLSLSKELKSTDYHQLKAGDVFIQGGSPGHAEIVVDVAVNPKTKKKIFILAQSFMPAQDIQILANTDHIEYSPWYEIDFNSTLNTPEWSFKWNQLKRFE
jgi:hypothetical protein